MALPDSFLHDLRENNDIVSVMQSYVELKRTGATYSCRCPFHSERTPSCHVYTDTQSFFCFGCQAGGDVITFIRRIENLDYIDAVKFLAQRAGMPMPEEHDDGSAKLRKRIYEMNRAAGRYFHQQLLTPAGKSGWDYITRRGLTLNTIKHFGIGYALDDYHALQMYMRGQGFTDEELEMGALLARNNNRVYDKFRDRVMFPIFDTRGNVIGFGGRALKADVPAKYLNSDETPVFKKRENLFALNYAKNSKADYFLMCEGYMDVISMHQAGFTSAVATLGTAITQEQARVISRMGKQEVILSYDSDAPGQKAASKGINLLSEVGVRARVLKMTGAKDPDEYINKFGAEAFGRLIANSGSAIDFELSKMSSDVDLDTPEGKSTYVNRAVKFLAQINNSLDREVYISRTAEIASIPAESVRNAVKKENDRRLSRKDKDNYRELIAPRITDKVNPDAAQLPREDKAERGIICYAYYNHDRLKYIQSKLTNGFVTEFNRRVFDFISKKVENAETLGFTTFNEEFNPDEMGRITSTLNRYHDFAFNDDVLNDFINTINIYYENKSKLGNAPSSDDELRALIDQMKEKKK